MKFTRLLAVMMALSMASFVGASSYAQEATPGGTEQATGTADAVKDIFGKKENISIKNTQNYKSCFKHKQRLIGAIPDTECAPYYFPLAWQAVYKFEYTEPVLVIEAVTEPGTSGIDDVPGQSGIQKLTGGMSASGRTTAYGGAERPAMPTAAHQPQAYFDAHVWGLGPMGRFASDGSMEEAQGEGTGKAKTKGLQAAQSMSCDIADTSLISTKYWVGFAYPDALLYILAAAPQASLAYMPDWGLSWFSGLGGLMDMASSFGNMADSMGSLGDMASGGLEGMGNMGNLGDSLGGAMKGMGGGLGGALGGLGSAFGGSLGGLGSLTSSVGGFMGGFGNIMGGVQNLASLGQGGAGGTAANMLTNFVGDKGNQSMFMVAGAAIALGYAMNSDDPDYVCQTKQQIDRGVESTTSMAAAARSDATVEKLKPGSFLPAGYPSDRSYDTCHLTGVGHYIDNDNKTHFVNCHPEERAMLLNCSRRTAHLMDRGETARRVNVPFAQIPMMDPIKDTCSSGAGIRFRDDRQDYAVVRVAQCGNRLSYMTQNGFHIACDETSKTYASCGRMLTGEAEFDRMKGSALEQELLAAGVEANKISVKGNFNVCAFPQGERVVDQLKDYNQGLQEFSMTASDFAAEGMIEAQAEINRKEQEMDAQCQNGRATNKKDGMGSKIAGAAKGIAGAAVASTAMNYLGKLGGKLSGKLGSGGATGEGGTGGLMGVLGSGTSHMTGNMLSQIPGAEAVTGFTDKMGGAIGGMGQSLANAAGISSATGALSNLNSTVSTYTNMYNMVAGGGLSQMANNLGDVFKITSEVFPVFLSEANENEWRDDRRASRQVSLNPMGMMGAGLKSMGCELAGVASGVTDMVGMGRIFDKSMQDVCLAWGPVQPLTGFIPTSGNDYPAAALAKWKAYQRAKVFIAKEKMEEDLWKFNLDYPHTSRCFDIGAPSTRWESRGMAMQEQVLPGMAGDILNNITGMLSGFMDSFGSMNFDKMKSGLQGGTKVEEGKFISTYWKESECQVSACAIDGKVQDFEREK